MISYSEYTEHLKSAEEQKAFGFAHLLAWNGCGKGSSWMMHRIFVIIISKEEFLEHPQVGEENLKKLKMFAVM